MGASDDELRHRIEARLTGGLATESAERAHTSEAVNAVVARLQRLAPEDIDAKLVEAGFTAHPYAADGIEQACTTCMYYLAHRQFCELPELRLPVEPQWSCRLWRI